MYAWCTFLANGPKGSVADVGAGRTGIQFFRSQIGADYYAIDGFAEGADIQCDFEKTAIPVPDQSFDTVLCLDTLEHVADPYTLIRECARIARSRVIISLPNNWASIFHWALFGRTGLYGYGLPPEPHPPGFAHKWFFNASEAIIFAEAQADAMDMAVVDIRCWFDKGATGLFGHRKGHKIVKLYRFVVSASVAQIKARKPGAVIPFLLVKHLVVNPISWIEVMLQHLIWGFGNRYLNIFSRNVWVVYERESPDA